MTEAAYADLVSTLQYQRSRLSQDGQIALDLLIRHADALRTALVEQVNTQDRWDQEWPVLGYVPHADEDNRKALFKRR